MRYKVSGGAMRTMIRRLNARLRSLAAGADQSPKACEEDPEDYGTPVAPV